MAQFCTKCGAPQTEGMRFCVACGADSGEPAAPAAQAPAAPAPVAPVAQTPPVAAPRPAPVAAAAAPAPSSGSPILKIILAVLGVMFIFGLLIVGAGAYFYYYHVKPKVTQIEKTVRSFPLPTGTPQMPTPPAAPGGGASGPGVPGPASPGGGSSSAPQTPAVLQIPPTLPRCFSRWGSSYPGAWPTAPDNRPDPHFPALTPGDSSVYSNPLVFQPGMTTALSISSPLWGDYDVLISVISVGEKGVTSNISSQSPANKPGATSPANATVTKAHEVHTDTPQDLMHATNIFSLFSNMFPEVIPGRPVPLFPGCLPCG